MKKQYRYELHAHTSEGSRCGNSTGAEMARGCAEKDFDGLVITDHFLHGNTAVDRSLPWEQIIRDYHKGYESAKAEGDRIGLDVFFGVEEGVGHGLEWLIYGLDMEWMIAHPYFTDLPHGELSALIHSCGGFISHAHPFREAGYIDGEGVPETELVDAIEVYNYCNLPEWDERAKRLADEKHLLYTAGSDTHDAFRFGAGMSFPYRIGSNAELTAALRSGDGTVFGTGRRCTE